MDVRKGFVDLVGNTPLVRLNKVSDATGCEILGKCEFLNPGGSGQGPGGAGDHPRRRGEGAAAARRHDRRGHRRQHRHRAGAGRQHARLPHRDRHPRDAEPGEDGHAAARGRRAAPGAGRALQGSEQLREAFPAGWPRSWRGPSRTARSGPTSSTMSPTGWATTAPPARRSGRRPAAGVDAFTCAVGTGGTLAGVGMFLKERKPASAHRARRPDGSGALPLLHARRAQGRRLLDQRGHRPGADHRQSRGRPGRRRVPDHRRRGPALHLRPRRRGGSGARRLLGDQHRRCRARRPGISGRAIPS